MTTDYHGICNYFSNDYVQPSQLRTFTFFLLLIGHTQPRLSRTTLNLYICLFYTLHMQFYQSSDRDTPTCLFFSSYYFQQYTGIIFHALTAALFQPYAREPDIHLYLTTNNDHGRFNFSFVSNSNEKGSAEGGHAAFIKSETT